MAGPPHGQEVSELGRAGGNTPPLGWLWGVLWPGQQELFLSARGLWGGWPHGGAGRFVGQGHSISRCLGLGHSQSVLGVGRDVLGLPRAGPQLGFLVLAGGPPTTGLRCGECSEHSS